MKNMTKISKFSASADSNYELLNATARFNCVVPLKNFLLLIFVLIISLNTIAQTGWYASFAGDTIVLNVSGQNGTIQWQQSSDSINWINIDDATATTYEFLTPDSPTGKWFYRAEITNTALCENSSWYGSVLKQKIITNTTQVSVGDWFHGGLTTISDSTGYGEVIPLNDQSDSMEWGCDNLVFYVTDTDGAVNTSTILTNCNTRPIAASICDDLILNGYSDWYLPSIAQYIPILNDPTSHLTEIHSTDYEGGYTDMSKLYWTSSTNSASCNNPQRAIVATSNIYYQTLIANTPRYSNSRVRCMRSFTPYDFSAKTYLYSTVVNNPISVNIIIQSNTQNKCSGNDVTFSVTTEGTSPVIYQWQKNGIDIPGATDSIYTIDNLNLTDQGNFTCEVTNLCRSVTSDTAKLKVIQLDANIGSVDNLCPGQTAKLNASCISNYPVESGSFSYLWSPPTSLSTTIQANTIANPSVTTNYTVTVTDQLGCTSSDQVNVFVQQPYQNEQVCLVTVDTSIMKNKIYWKKTNDVGTMLYIIYKEAEPDIYIQAGNVSPSHPGEFTDLISHPNLHSDKYKITVVDSCGNESGLSDFHKTIKLNMDAFDDIMCLGWEEYIDQTGVYSPTKYYIYRGASPETMVLHDSVWGFINTFNDYNVDSVYFYMIGIRKNNPDNFNGNMSFSNIVNNSCFINNSSNVSENNTEHKLFIYPNPFNETTTVKFYNPENKSFILTLSDIKGTIIRKTFNVTGNEIQIEKQQINPGIYLLKLISDDLVYTGKIMIK